MQPGWKWRTVVWLALAESVRANYRAYPRLPTAWLPHGVANSLALWLPELLATTDHLLHAGARCAPDSTAEGLYRTLRDVCTDNHHWVFYVAPAALGYAVSHPRFNIYKGDLAALRVAGFGLDAIPHSLTAYALAHLFQDGIVALARNLPPASPWSSFVRRLARHPAWVSGALLALLTVIWESGEYNVQQEELRRMGGDRTAINMEWTVTDMLFDLFANFAGWAVAARQTAVWAGAECPDATSGHSLAPCSSQEDA